MPPGDKKIWEAYAKGVKRLKGGKTQPPAPRAVKNAASVFLKSKTEQKKRAVQPLDVVRKKTAPDEKDGKAALSPQLDKRTERAMRRGGIALEARLDLHGLTQQEAHAALSRFVERQAAEGKRKLLVITGKGSKGCSPLRANLPRWCAEPPLCGHILALRPAAPQHGGAGAWYVVLRNTNKKTGAQNDS